VARRHAAGGGVRRGKGGRALEAGPDRIDAARVDEHARLGGDELRRTADRGGDHRPLAGHGLEDGLPERLLERGLAEDVTGGDPLRDSPWGLRRFVNVYVQGEDIRFLDGLDTRSRTATR
jgi:hypothetical protein